VLWQMAFACNSTTLRTSSMDPDMVPLRTYMHRTTDWEGDCGLWVMARASTWTDDGVLILLFSMDGCLFQKDIDPAEAITIVYPIPTTSSIQYMCIQICLIYSYIVLLGPYISHGVSRRVYKTGSTIYWVHIMLFATLGLSRLLLQHARQITF
jgi:hypothetical protein